MAAGPAIASLLGRVDFPEDNLIWTVETSPGWVMLTLWSIYYISAVLFFEEPDRSHLFSTKPIESTELFVIDTERQPLIKNISTISSLQIEKKVYPLYRNIPVMMTLWIYFVLKLALECLLSSSATVASYYFEWDARHTGTFLAVLGLLMFPANLLVAKLSHRFEDREIIYVTLIMMFLSVLGMIAYRPSHYSMKQYTFFGVCVFLSTNSLEGPNMSLLSKTIPRSWAKGTFNSGFLATEAGTAARSVGDVLISAVASLLGFSNLLNATFLPLTVLVLVSIILTRHFFESMVEEDEDDDEESEVIYSETNVDSVND
jgi:MFS-type transporter involved in bile tolerance (Atg22 family)